MGIESKFLVVDEADIQDLETLSQLVDRTSCRSNKRKKALNQRPIPC